MKLFSSNIAITIYINFGIFLRILEKYVILYLTLFLMIKAGKASNTNTSGFLYYV